MQDGEGKEMRRFTPRRPRVAAFVAAFVERLLFHDRRVTLAADVDLDGRRPAWPVCAGRYAMPMPRFQAGRKPPLVVSPMGSAPPFAYTA